MAKEDILNFYNNSIVTVQEEVWELRQKTDDALDYIGQLQRKKYELECEK